MEQNNILEIAKKGFEAWNSALQTRDPEKVSELYRNDCTFMPTFPEKGKEIVGKNGVADYFSHFLLKLPYGKIIREEIKEISEGIIRHSGLYDFEIGEEENRTIVHAKFIFEWKKENEQWKILFHGSFPMSNQ